MTEIKRREKFRDVWLDILHSISGLCEVGKWSKNVSKLDVVDVSNGRAALSGSFINVRAPNFLQPKTSLSSCRRPLPFELFSKKRQLALVPFAEPFLAPQDVVSTEKKWTIYPTGIQTLFGVFLGSWVHFHIYYWVGRDEKWADTFYVRTTNYISTTW